MDTKDWPKLSTSIGPKFNGITNLNKRKNMFFCSFMDKQEFVFNLSKIAQLMRLSNVYVISRNRTVVHSEFVYSVCTSRSTMSLIE